MRAEIVQAGMEYGVRMALITLLPAKLAGMDDWKKRVPRPSGHKSLDAVMEWAVRVFCALAISFLLLSISMLNWQKPDVGAVVTGAALGAMAAVRKSRSGSGL